MSRWRYTFYHLFVSRSLTNPILNKPSNKSLSKPSNRLFISHTKLANISFASHYQLHVPFRFITLQIRLFWPFHIHGCYFCTIYWSSQHSIQIKIKERYDNIQDWQVIRCCEDSDGCRAVSYTHLDVYKRQPFILNVCTSWKNYNLILNLLIIKNTT